MNDDTPSTSEQLQSNLDDGISNAHASSSTAADSNDGSLRHKAQVQRDQKATFLDHLIRSIDIMVYCQLSILYYMDASLTKFLIRALPHWFYFTPKPSVFPPPPLTHRPYIGIIFGSNIVCMLLHLLFKPPVAGEAARGYLNGGLMIDFVGQASPVSKWKLMGLDALVTALQVLILSVTLERRRVSNNSAEGVDQMASDTRQDHDSEERGILRQDASTIEDLELRDLPHASAGRTGGDQDRERDELLLHSDLGLPDHHPLDSYYTGENIIVNLHIVDTVRAQWQSSGGSAHGSTEAGSSGAQAAAVAVVAGRSLSYRFGETLQQAG